MPRRPQLRYGRPGLRYHPVRLAARALSVPSARAPEIGGTLWQRQTPIEMARSATGWSRRARSRPARRAAAAARRERGGGRDRRTDRESDSRSQSYSGREGMSEGGGVMYENASMSSGSDGGDAGRECAQVDPFSDTFRSSLDNKDSKIKVRPNQIKMRPNQPRQARST